MHCKSDNILDMKRLILLADSWRQLNAADHVSADQKLHDAVESRPTPPVCFNFDAVNAERRLSWRGR